MPATLRVTREGFGIELRRGRFEITVDDHPVGEINYRDTVETPVEPGAHTLRIRHGRYHSPARTFEAADGDEVRFRCHGANLWPLWAVSYAVPALAISLTRE